MHERDLAVAVQEDARFHALLEQAVDVGHGEVRRHREVTHIVGLAEQRRRREQRAALGGHALDAGRHRPVEGAEVDRQVLVLRHEAAGLDAEVLDVEAAAQDLLGEQRVASGGFDDQLDEGRRRGNGRDESEQLPQLGSREALQRQGDGAGLTLEPSDGTSDAFVVDRGANREDGQHPDATRRRCVVEQHEQVQEQRLARGIGPLQVVDDEHHGLVPEHVEQGLLRPAPQVGRILLDSAAGAVEVERPRQRGEAAVRRDRCEGGRDR